MSQASGPSAGPQPIYRFSHVTASAEVDAATTLCGRVVPMLSARTQANQLSLGGADALVAARGDVWVADSTDAVVVRVDPHSVTQSGVLTGSFGHPGSVAVGQEAVWVLDPGNCSLFRVDPVTGKAARPFILPLFRAAAVVAGDEGVSVTPGTSGAGCG